MVEELKWGNSIWEIVDVNGRVKRMKRLDPRTMHMFPTPYGTIDHWEQHVPVTGEVIKFRPDQIAHFRLSPGTNSMWSQGLLQASLQDLKDYDDLQRHIMRLMQRHTYPLTMVQMGDSETSVDDSDAAKLADEIEDAKATDSWVIVDGLVNIIQAKGDTTLPDIKPVWEIFTQKVIADLEIPQVEWAAEKMSDAAARERTKSKHEKVLWLQRVNHRHFEWYVLSKEFKTNNTKPPPIRIIYKQVSKEGYYSDAKAESQLMQFGVKTPNEARKSLNLPPLTDEDLAEMVRVFDVVRGTQGDGKEVDKAHGPDEVKARRSESFWSPEPVPETNGRWHKGVDA